VIRTGKIRGMATFLSALLVLAVAGVAQAEVAPRLADLEVRTTSPFEFDQVSRHCSTSTATRDTTRPYSGIASLRVHTEVDPACQSSFSRGIFNANSSRHLVEGDDFWFGAAIYLPTGFYAAHNGYTDLLRIDSYVSDGGANTPYADRAEINFASWSNDSLYVVAARGGTKRTLIGPLSPSALPEGKWNWVEAHVRLSASGAAYTELKIDGVSRGSSTAPNLFVGAAPFNRLRYGLVSTESDGSGSLTAYFDRASIASGERGPLQQSPPPPEQPAPEPPAPEIDPNPSLVSLWRLDELSGTTAADATGVAPGAYVNSPTRGAPGIAPDGGTAAAFNGSDEYVAISPPAALDPTQAITIEAWFDADAFSGSLVQRYEAYELRPQANGSVVWRVWIEGTMMALLSKPEVATPGQPHQLVGTYDGTKMKLYLDGYLIAQRTASGSLTHGAYPLYLGRNAYVESYFGGTIDDVSIYSEALSPMTVLEHFQA